MTPPATSSALKELLTHATGKAAEAGVFGVIEFRQDPSLSLRCHAKTSAEPAFYSLFMENDALFVALQTPARYLSQSIEADLVFTGDKLEELLHEEMVELGYDAAVLPFQHFRSEDLLYTFRTPLPVSSSNLDSPAARELAVQALLGYEATFRALGDMEAGGDEG